MVTPVAFTNIKHHTYTIFAIINAIMVPSVYFFFPETAYRSLEEMDTIFQKVKGWKGAFTVIHQAEIEPRRYGKNGELLIAVSDVGEVGEKGNVEHRNGSSSETSTDANNGMFINSDEETQRGPQ
jgi:hypothetical protein